jgi:hypothetical protein
VNIDPNSPVGREILKALADGRATAVGVNRTGLAAGLGGVNFTSPRCQNVPSSSGAFQDWVIAEARLRGWACAHFRCVRVTRRNGETYYETPVAADGKGWPDLCLVRDRILFRELKTGKATLEPDQELWRDRIIRAGGDWALWHPRDAEDIIEELT